MKKYICIHGHFYQPPRENPWTEKIEKQPSAHPYHDWNERITSECYLPNSHCEIVNSNGQLMRTLNNYSHISFNFGPTLLSWMEKNSQQAYNAIIQADKDSIPHFSGHGSALAQVYNHIIMPLANNRDKQTQIVWGIKDFEYRFKRKPEGMWLAETAVDTNTLEILADHEIKFTILAPRQAHRTRTIGSNKWLDVSNQRINPFCPYLHHLPSGKTIALFFYDGPISQDIAFNNLLANGEKFGDRLLHVIHQDKEEPKIVHIATDGETYGHHHAFGDRALGYCLQHIMNNAKLTVYGEYLQKHSIDFEVEIFENSSWSCVHGVERWRSSCGCGSENGRQLDWRKPLRDAMNWLRDQVGEIYENKMKKYHVEPWAIRNHYIEIILDETHSSLELFFMRHFPQKLSSKDKTNILCLLEMQRHSLLMYTSCGWFFDDISRIEAVQIMAYAARCIQLADKFRFFILSSLEKKFLSILALAPCNEKSFENGADVYIKLVRPIIKKSSNIEKIYE